MNWNGIIPPKPRDPYEESHFHPRQPSNPWKWPLICLVILITITLLGTILALAWGTAGENIMTVFGTIFWVLNEIQ